MLFNVIYFNQIKSNVIRIGMRSTGYYKKKKRRSVSLEYMHARIVKHSKGTRVDKISSGKDLSNKQIFFYCISLTVLTFLGSVNIGRGR